jgi:hypothetical protein
VDCGGDHVGQAQEEEHLLFWGGERRLNPRFLDEEEEANLWRLEWRPEESMDVGLVIRDGRSPKVPGLRGSVRSRRRRFISFKQQSWGPEVQGLIEAPSR